MKKTSLSEEIGRFQRDKKILIPVCLILGIFGLFLPIIPGVALLFLGFLLIFPSQGESILKRVRQKVKILRKDLRGTNKNA